MVVILRKLLQKCDGRKAYKKIAKKTQKDEITSKVIGLQLFYFLRR